MERLIIILIIFFLAFLFFIYKFIKQHKAPIITTYASIVSVVATSNPVLSPAVIYYAVFKSENNEDIRVAINYKMYKKFKVGDKGLLTYKGTKLIDWIKKDSQELMT